MGTILKIALLVLVAGSIVLLTGTGAFTTADVERSTTVGVVGDSQALVQVTPYTDSAGQQSEFAGIIDGQLAVSLNVDAVTDADDVFNVTNQGTQPVAVWITDVDIASDVAGGVDENNTADVTFYNPQYGGASATENGMASVEGRANAVRLDVGETLVVSIYVDTTRAAANEVDLLDSMMIHASARVDGAPGPNDGGSGGQGAPGSGDGGDGGDGAAGAVRITPNANAQPHTIGNGQQTFTVHNDGDDPVTVTDVVLVGQSPGEFQIVSGGGGPYTLGSTGPPHQISVQAVDAADGSTAVLRIVTDAGTFERTIED